MTLLIRNMGDTLVSMVTHCFTDCKAAKNLRVRNTMLYFTDLKRGDK